MALSILSCILFSAFSNPNSKRILLFFSLIVSVFIGFVIVCVFLNKKILRSSSFVLSVSFTFAIFPSFVLSIALIAAIILSVSVIFTIVPSFDSLISSFVLSIALIALIAAIILFVSVTIALFPPLYTPIVAGTFGNNDALGSYPGGILPPLIWCITPLP